MNPTYEQHHLDHFVLWENDTGAIYIFHHGLSDYKGIWFTKIDGVCHPVDKFEFRDADWMLKLIHKQRFHPSQGDLKVVRRPANDSDGVSEQA